MKFRDILNRHADEFVSGNVDIAIINSNRLCHAVTVVAHSVKIRRRLSGLSGNK